MTEAVRLVIWDLDETFWQGTITEGGHRYSQAAHDIVLELARRGIMSSICSKNDLAPVREILTQSGLWDSFIFPSINWEPKGPRIAALIETVQLRAPTVLFIDDNPSNLSEAQHYAPGLQVADETIIPMLLDNPLLRGKDDRGLKRLAQYKVLERRRADEQAAISQSNGSNVGFLRSSHIRVRIERDIEGHIDRAVELINRTNQLNFTKNRLPEDAGAAREALRRKLGHHMVQAGLLQVIDDYGDHGYCGFYLTRTFPTETELQHFCFSCRILGMGVEAWAYQILGRPKLAVRGAVLSDPVAADQVDWISVVTSLDGKAAAPAAAGERSSFAARGGCLLMPLTHYFAADASQTVGEYNVVRDGNAIRLDHSLCFRHALDGMSSEVMAAAELLGYEPADFQSRYFEHTGPHPIWLFSNWSDLGVQVFRHRETGARFPCLMQRREHTPGMTRVKENLQAHFLPDGFMSAKEMQDNLRAVFSRVPAHGRMFVLLALETFIKDGEVHDAPKRIRLNRWIGEVAREFANVQTLMVGDFVHDPSEVDEGTVNGHFARMVYYRIYRHIGGLMAAPPDAARKVA